VSQVTDWWVGLRQPQLYIGIAWLCKGFYGRYNRFQPAVS